MVVQHNLTAINSGRMFGITYKKSGKLAEKLSSGYKINRSADDAAGLAISEKMRRQIRGLTQAAANAQDGISVVQSAEGALQEMQNAVQRGNELAIKAANGTLSDADRAMVDGEIQQLKQMLDESAHTTTFNDFRIFPDDGNAPGNVMQQKSYKVKFDLASGNIQVDQIISPSTTNTTGTGGAGSVLADKLANEFIPNAVQQILATFPSLKNEVGNNTITMDLDVSYIDGPSGTLAYASCAFYPTGKPIDFLVKVDTSDFTDADATGTGANAEMLESTVAHELMHAVMYYALPDGMTGRKNTEFPEWFIEGTAQIVGGGYTTGWNTYLTNVANALTDENDTSWDQNIANYLKSYTMASRPYGHGYLGTAYLGYLASGETVVSDQAIARGIDLIMEDMIINNKTLDQAMATATNNVITGSASLEAMFANGNTNLVSFVRQLSKLSETGAGSVIAGGLGVGGTNILGNTANVNQSFIVNQNNINVNTAATGKGLRLHVGAESNIGIEMQLFNVDAEALGLKSTNVLTVTDAKIAIDSFKSAISGISRVRSYYGALQNRLEHTINNLENVIENTTAAESRIRDTDMAKLMVEYSNNQILIQAGQAMLVQANNSNDLILSLLQ